MKKFNRVVRAISLFDEKEYGNSNPSSYFRMLAENLYIGHLKGSLTDQLIDFRNPSRDTMKKMLQDIGASIAKTDSPRANLEKLERLATNLFTASQLHVSYVGCFGETFEEAGFEQGWFQVYADTVDREFAAVGEEMDFLNPAVFKPTWEDNWWYRDTTGRQRFVYRRKLAHLLLKKYSGDASPCDVRIDYVIWDGDPDHDFVVKMSNGGEKISVRIADTEEKASSLKQQILDCWKRGEIPKKQAIVLVQEKYPEERLASKLLEQIKSSFNEWHRDWSAKGRSIS